MTSMLDSLGARLAGTLGVAGCLGLAGCATTDIDTQERPVTPTTAPAVIPPPSGATEPPPAVGKKGGYYLDDGPDEVPPRDLDAIPDAVPRVEPLLQGTLKPYTALGNNYMPMTRLEPYKALGIASWYGRRYHGKATASGEIYDMYRMTAAHTTLPLPSYARVTSLRTGKSVVVRVNDRGPFHSDRLIDLSYAAAHRIGLLADGSGPVEVEVILPVEAAPAARIQAEPLPVDPPAAPAETPAAEPQAAAMPDTPPADADGYFLQFGAFSSLPAAEAFMRKLRADYPDLDKPLAVVSGKGLFRVQAGPYADRDAAKREADRAASRTGFRPFPTRR